MGKRILVVEDEAVVRKALRLLLGKWGYEVTEAENGEQAVLRLGSEEFDLMICDVMMPRKDGWQLLRELRSSPKKGGLPVIILTAKSADADMFKSYELGATYYMSKPFTKQQLRYGLDLVFGEKDMVPGTIDLTQVFNESEKAESEAT